MKKNKSLHALLLIIGMLFTFPALLTAQDNKEVGENSEMKQMTRAEFASMTENQRRNFIYDFNQVNITDLVNVTPEQYSNRTEGAIYLSLEEYKNSDSQKQMHMVLHPETYKIYNTTAVNAYNNSIQQKEIKTNTISQQELKKLPADKQKSIIESKQYIITE